MTQQQMEIVLSSWANMDTWHTCHPLDQERFYNSLHQIEKEYGAKSFSANTFRNALMNIASNNGIAINDEYWDKKISDYSTLAEEIMEYLKYTR